MMQIFSYNVSGTATMLFPTMTFFALLELPNKEILEIQKEHPFNKGWGEPQSIHIYERDSYPMPQGLDMVYLSVVEQKFYSIVTILPFQRMESIWNHPSHHTEKSLYTNIVIGMAPYGGIALWLHGQLKASLVEWMHGEVVDVKMSDFMPLKPNAKLKDICTSFINSNPRVRDNLVKNGLPPRDLFDNYMKQFTYRYQVFFEQWNEEEALWRVYNEEKLLPMFDYIEESLFDGTHDKLHDGGLMDYHKAGKPKKLAVKWHIKKSEYTAYFWFEDEIIRNIFDRFYNTRPDTKADFIIRIDSDKKKFELALYRYGLKEPQVISESAYQLIVFKNKFEYFRSENYNQPRGAWIW